MALPTTTRSSVGGDVLGAVALQRRDPLLLQEVAHRRVDVLVGSAHVVAAALEQGGERGHGGPADANQVDSRHLRCAPVSPRSVLASIQRPLPRSPAPDWVRPTTRARTPSGSVSVAPLVCPDGRPNSTGPGKSFISGRTVALAAGEPPGSSQPGSSPKTTADVRARMPARRSWVSIRSSRYGRSDTSSRNSTDPAGERKQMAFPVTRRAASACRRRGSLPPPLHQRLELRMRDLAGRLGAAEHRTNVSRS